MFLRLRSSTSLTVVASGADIGGTADSFHFVHQPLTGDGEIIARVATLGGAFDPASKAGVMFRAGLEPGAANVMLAVLGDAAMGGRLQARASAGGPTSALPVDGAVKSGQFLRLARTGRTFTAFRSGNRATWTRIGSVWPHADGKGFNVQLDAVPLDGRITLRVAEDKKD